MSSRTFTSRGAVWLGLFLLGGPVLAGCNNRPPHEFSMGIGQVDSGVPDGGIGTGGAGAGIVPGTGGQGGGSGGISGGTGGAGNCVPSGPETCGNLGVDNDCDGDPNDVDPDQLLDPANCGACFNLCNQANASNIQCLQDPSTGVIGCQFTCLAGFADADGNSTNGCECQITSATELCNGKDDNCNNMVDEGFDLTSDINNCGRCGVTCEYPFAQATCAAGTCTMGACLPGFFDANKMDSDGCECQKTNGGVEVCDGIDNNCDGVIDEPANVIGAPACKTKGVCAGVTATCHGTSGWSCDYSVDYQAVEDTAKGCDGKDNDCDGLVDEAFDIGKACQVGSGPCAGTGTWICDATNPAGHSCNGTMKAPQPEICNGLDDDCDGEVDELNSVADRTTDDKIVYYAAKNVTIFAFEATRFDATASSAGVVSNHRPCAVPGKLPWSNVTSDEAAAACAMIGTGWRLCTTDEWGDACNGRSTTASDFPYGPATAYSPTTCVGFDYASPAAPTPTGTATMCVSDASVAPATASAATNIYDMSGNVKEWVTTTSTTTYAIRGGAYDIVSFTAGNPPTRTAPGLQCDASTPAPSVPVRLPSVGFRCCLTGQLPAQ